MKFFPIMLAACVSVAATAYIAATDKPIEGDLGKLFVACAAANGAIECGKYLEAWAKRPGAKEEIVARVQADAEFARYFLEYGDAE